MVGDPVPKDDRGLGVRPPFHLLELLHPERHAPEGQRDVGLAGGVAGSLKVGEAEGVERRGLHGGDGLLERFQRRQLPAPEGVDQAAGVSQPWRRHKAESTRRPLAAPH